MLVVDFFIYQETLGYVPFVTVILLGDEFHCLFQCHYFRDSIDNRKNTLIRNYIEIQMIFFYIVSVDEQFK